MRWTRRILVAAGTAAMAYAIVGLLSDPATDPPRQFAFLVAVLVAHDAVFLPLVLGAGALVSRWAPPPLRTPIRVAGIVSLALAVVATPFVLGFGRRHDDPPRCRSTTAAVYSCCSPSSGPRRPRGDSSPPCDPVGGEGVKHCRNLPAAPDRNAAAITLPHQDPDGFVDDAAGDRAGSPQSAQGVAGAGGLGRCAGWKSSTRFPAGSVSRI